MYMITNTPTNTKSNESVKNIMNTTTSIKSNDSVFFHHHSDKWQPNMVMVNAHACALTTMVNAHGTPLWIYHVG